MTIIDPPSGWKYGFPKPIPEDRMKDSTVWLVEQGYPQELIDKLGEQFYCRYWNEPEDTKMAGIVKKSGNDFVILHGSNEWPINPYPPTEILKEGEYVEFELEDFWETDTDKHTYAVITKTSQNEREGS